MLNLLKCFSPVAVQEMEPVLLRIGQKGHFLFLLKSPVDEEAWTLTVVGGVRLVSDELTGKLDAFLLKKFKIVV